MNLSRRQKAALAKMNDREKRAAMALYARQAQQQRSRTQPQHVPQQLLRPRRAPVNVRGRRLQPVASARASNAAMAAMMQASLVKGLGRVKLSSGELFQGGALRNSQFAPRGHGYFDAFKMQPQTAVLANAVGPVTPIVGHARLPLPGHVGYIPANAQNSAGNNSTYESDSTSGSGQVTLHVPMPQTNSRILVFNVGSSDETVGFWMYPNVEGSMEVENLNCSAFTGLADPTINNGYTMDAHGGNPDNASRLAQGVESIPLRGSIKIVNTTERRFQGGVVRTLRYNGSLLFGHDMDPGDNASGVNFNPTVESYFALRDLIRDSARTQHYSGEDFSSPKQFNLHPADFIRSHTFSADKTFYEAVRYPRFNTLLVLIDDFTASGTTNNNSYEANCIVQRAGRFSPGTLHHNNAKDMKQDADFLGRMTAIEQKLGMVEKPSVGPR